MPLATAALPILAMRVCQALTHGQWLHMKITMVPFLPAASASVISFSSTPVILVSAIGAAAPIASTAPAASPAGAWASDVPAHATAATAIIHSDAMRFILMSLLGSPRGDRLIHGLVEAGLVRGAFPEGGQSTAAVVHEGGRDRTRPFGIEGVDEIVGVAADDVRGVRHALGGQEFSH